MSTNQAVESKALLGAKVVATPTGEDGKSLGFTVEGVVTQIVFNLICIEYVERKKAKTYFAKSADVTAIEKPKP
jgi:hypothetical protein